MRNRLAHYFTDEPPNASLMVAVGFCTGLGWFAAESMWLTIRTYLVAIAGMLGMVP